MGISSSGEGGRRDHMPHIGEAFKQYLQQGRALGK